MYYRLCKYSVILVIINFVFLMTGIATYGILRFVSTISYLFNLFLLILLLVNGKVNKNGLASVILFWAMYVLLHILFVPNHSIGRPMILLESFYWISFFFIVQYWFTAFNYSDVIWDKWILRLFYIIVGATLCSFLIGGGKYNDEGVLVARNVIFYPVLLAPWLASVNNSRKKWLAIGILLLLTFFSLKRSALIIVLITTVLVFFDKGKNNKKGRSSSEIVPFVFIIGVVGCLSIIPNSPLLDVQSRFENIEEDDGNGRLIIYASVLDKYSSFSPLKKAIGAGYKSVQYDMSGGDTDIALSAHNDYIEVLYDYGYIGELIYMYLLLFLLFRSIKYIREKKFYGVPSMIAVLSFIVMCMVSNLIIYPTYFLFLVSFWAFCENQYRLKNEYSNSQRNALSRQQ